jgi:hypothetical protein
MRSWLAWIGLGVLVIGGAGAVLIGCPAAHDDFPGLSCKTDGDCYQGEMCINMVCMPPPMDMTMPEDFPHPDFSMHQDLSGDDGGPDVDGGADL